MKSFVSMAVVSLSQPVNVPSNPVYVTATVAAGVYTTASVYVINTGTQVQSLYTSYVSSPLKMLVLPIVDGHHPSVISKPALLAHCDGADPKPYLCAECCEWEFYRGELSVHVVVPVREPCCCSSTVMCASVLQVSVGFNFTSPQSGPIASSVDQFGVTAFPSETASFSVTITYPGQPASPIIAGVAVLVMTPGASNAATSTYQILSGATIGPAITLDPSSAMYYRASKSVALSVVVGNQIQIAVTPRDSFGNAQTKSIALGTVTASECMRLLDRLLLSQSLLFCRQQRGCDDIRASAFTY